MYCCNLKFNLNDKISGDYTLMVEGLINKSSRRVEEQINTIGRGLLEEQIDIDDSLESSILFRYPNDLEPLIPV